MPTVQSEEIRIPRRVREAVARHERVVVLNRERPVMAIVHPDEVEPAARRRGRPMREIVSALAGVPSPDPDFVRDMELVRESVGPLPQDPWERS